MSRKTFIIAVAGHSGAGKTTLIRELAVRLGNSSTLAIDQYEGSYYPPIQEWIERGADPDEFRLPGFDADVTALANGDTILHPETKESITPASFLILEEPFGRGRTSIRELIDFVVYLDIPLDVSYVRKISRKDDFLPWEENPELFMRNLRQNMGWYLRVGRRFYLAVGDRARDDCDLIVNALRQTDDIVDEVLQKIQTFRSNGHKS